MIRSMTDEKSDPSPTPGGNASTIETVQTTGKVGAVILAAGLGARMGRLKQVVPIAGEPLVRNVARIALAAGLAPIWVVTGHGADEVKSSLENVSPTVRFVHNPNYADGQASSLRAGVKAAATDPDVDGVVLLLGDQPYVRPETVARLCKRAFAPEMRAAAVLYGPGLPGPPCLFRRELWDDVLGATGDQGARATLRRLGERLAVVPVDNAELRDIDTPSDVP